MKEGIDPKLKEEWEKKLDMPEEISSEDVEIRSSGRDVFAEVKSEREGSFLKFADLPEKLQDDIIADSEKQRNMGVPISQVLDRFEVMVEGGHTLNKMSASDSDKNFKPKPTKEELENKKIEESATRDVNTFIERLKRIRNRDKFKPIGIDKYKN